MCINVEANLWPGYRTGGQINICGLGTYFNLVYQILHPPDQPLLDPVTVGDENPTSDVSLNHIYKHEWFTTGWI